MNDLDSPCVNLANSQNHLPYGVAVTIAGRVAGGETVGEVAGWVESGTVAVAGAKVGATSVAEGPGAGVCKVETGIPVPAKGV